MSQNLLAVQIRQAAGKGVARKLRAAGRIPGVLYGKGEPATSITLDPHSLERAISRSEAGMNTLFDISVEGGGAADGRVVLVREIQRDPVDGTALHADLYAVDLSQKITVSVPLHLAGRARGVELDGGILDQSLREIELECLPRSIPDEVVIDVSDLGLGDTIHVRDVVLPEGVELLSDPDLSVLSVVAPAAAEEEAPAIAEGVVPAEGEAPAEPAAEEAEKAEESSGE